jgi:hypothetical protein
MAGYGLCRITTMILTELAYNGKMTDSPTETVIASMPYIIFQGLDEYDPEAHFEKEIIYHILLIWKRLLQGYSGLYPCLIIISLTSASLTCSKCL